MKRITSLSLLVLFVQGVTATATPAQTSEKDSAVVEREVREVFDKWSTALGCGDKKTYLDTFWNSPRLVIRVANGEWRGIEAYRKRIEAAQLPPASPSDYKNVEVVGLGRDAAVVTYERPAPAGATGPAGESVIFKGTAAFIRTAEGWKIAAWHAHSVPEKSSAH
ncbi:MAG: AtzH-like domain-containing protein [Blastocatellia bacterium]